MPRERGKSSLNNFDERKKRQSIGDSEFLINVSTYFVSLVLI